MREPLPAQTIIVPWAERKDWQFVMTRAYAPSSYPKDVRFYEGQSSNRYSVNLGPDPERLGGYFDPFIQAGFAPKRATYQAASLFAPWVSWNAFELGEVMANEAEAKLSNMGMDSLLLYRDLVLYVTAYEYAAHRPGYASGTGLSLIGVQPLPTPGAKWIPIPPRAGVTG